ncbi:hypothetical protein K7432_007069 [Basidiobolus ranarum]|uniref:Uncharacterized protein n=1 Tax=Basidiobolus ranarum TaxID=34480 RepID=A0ABR2WTW1_9FUNG
MPPENSGTIEAHSRSFILGIAELPNLFQQKIFLLSRFSLRPSSLLRFFYNRPLLMDKPYWREEELRNWHISEPTFRVKSDTALEPYSLIHQRLFDDIMNDHVTVVVQDEDVQLPSLHSFYYLSVEPPMENQNPAPIELSKSKSLQKTPIFTLNNSRSSATIASPIASTLFGPASNPALWSFDNSKMLLFPEPDKVEEETVSLEKEIPSQDLDAQVAN